MINLKKNCRQLALLAVMTALAANALAQESRLELQAGRCSAIFSMLSDTHQSDEMQANFFRHFMEIFTDLYAKERKERTGNAEHKNGLQRRNEILQEFRDTYKDRQAAMKEEVVLCGAWAEGYRAQGDTYAYVPIIPKLIPQSVRDIYENLAAISWSKWLN